jgi:hypothetical protein
MNYKERLRPSLPEIYAIFPDAQIEYDNTGEMIIYTGWYEDEARIREESPKD